MLWLTLEILILILTLTLTITILLIKIIVLSTVLFEIVDMETSHGSYQAIFTPALLF